MVGHIAPPPGLEVVNLLAAMAAQGPPRNLQAWREQTAGTLLGRTARMHSIPEGLDEKALPRLHGRWRQTSEKQPQLQRLLTPPTEPAKVVVQSMLPPGENIDAQGAELTSTAPRAVVVPSLHQTASTAGRKLSLTSALGFSCESESSHPVSAPTPSGMPMQITPSVDRPTVPSGALDEESDLDAFIFAFTIRVAEGAALGLITSVPWDPSNEGPASHLRIDSIPPGGAVEAWNRQCGSSGAPEKVLLLGDKITSVNHKAGTDAMLREIQSSRLLRLLIVRTPGSAHIKTTSDLPRPVSTSSTSTTSS